jgi:8-oxo-dGTP pyrophosphatase MutT (NUDIX family)
MNPTFKNRPNELITTTDGRKLYHSRSVAVVGVFGMYIGASLNVIIEKRGTAPGLDKQGLWCLPCGYLDWGESGPEAIRRELWEEVGIDLMDYLTVCHSPNYTQQPWHVKTEPDENRQNVTLRYGAVWSDLHQIPVLKPNNACDHPNEVADAKWMPISDITKYQFAFNHDKVLLDFYHTKMM